MAFSKYSRSGTEEEHTSPPYTYEPTTQIHHLEPDPSDYYDPVLDENPQLARPRSLFSRYSTISERLFKHKFIPPSWNLQHYAAED